MNVSASQKISTGLYDSDTGASLMATKIVDISDMQSEYVSVLLIYTSASRGRIVQVRRANDAESMGTNIHYFFDEQEGAAMIDEDERRLGFPHGTLHSAVRRHAPTAV